MKTANEDQTEKHDPHTPTIKRTSTDFGHGYISEKAAEEDDDVVDDAHEECETGREACLLHKVDDRAGEWIATQRLTGECHACDFGSAKIRFSEAVDPASAIGHVALQLIGSDHVLDDRMRIVVNAR